jgi:hypothetical protein
MYQYSRRAGAAAAAWKEGLWSFRCNANNLPANQAGVLLGATIAVTFETVH